MLAIGGTLLFGLSQTYLFAAIGRFLVGMAASCCFLGCIRMASRWFPANKMALVSGSIVTMAMVGGLVAQTPMAMLSQMVGWRQAILLDAGLGVLIWIMIAMITQDYPNTHFDKKLADKTHLKSLGLVNSIKLVTSNRQNWLCGLYTMLMNLPVFLLGAIWGIHYLQQVHNLSLIQSSYATTLFFVGAIIGSPIFGWISDRLGKRVQPMLMGTILSLVVILILMLGTNLSLISLITLFFLIGFLTSSQVLSYPTIAESNPHALTGTALSIASMIIMGSGVIFQPLFGWAMELTWDGSYANGVPVYTSIDFFNAMLIMPIAFVLSLVIAYFIKETHCKA